jgi:hypothetical protein
MVYLSDAHARSSRTPFTHTRKYTPTPHPNPQLRDTHTHTHTHTQHTSRGSSTQPREQRATWCTRPSSRTLSVTVGAAGKRTPSVCVCVCVSVFGWGLGRLHQYAASECSLQAVDPGCTANPRGKWWTDTKEYTSVCNNNNTPLYALHPCMCECEERLCNESRHTHTCVDSARLSLPGHAQIVAPRTHAPVHSA